MDVIIQILQESPPVGINDEGVVVPGVVSNIDGGVNANAIEMVVDEKIVDCVDDVVFYLRFGEVQARAPLSHLLFLVLGEIDVYWPIEIRQNALKCKMIWHKIEENADSNPMRGIYQRLEVVRRSIVGMNGPQGHRIVAPAIDRVSVKILVDWH